MNTKLILLLGLIASLNSNLASAQEAKGRYEVALEKNAQYQAIEKQFDEEVDLAVQTEARGIGYRLYVNAQTEATCRIHILAITDKEAIHECGAYKVRTFIDRSEYKTGLIYFQIFADKNPEKVLGEATALEQPSPLRI